MPKNIFAVKKDNKTTYLKVAKEKVNIPGYGVMTKEELIENEPALVYTLSSDVFQNIFEEATKKEYYAFVAAEKAEQEALEKEEMEKAHAEEKAAYDQAKAIVDAYEQKYGSALKLKELQEQYEKLTGNKAGNKKAETLQKEISELQKSNES